MLLDELFRVDPLTAGTKALVYVGDKVLVYRRDNNTSLHPLEIDLPGGGPEADETPFQTLQREMHEEFGLHIAPENIMYVRRYPSVLESGKFGYFAVAKLPVAAAKNIVFGDEGVEYLLLPLDDYLARTDAWPIYQDRARDYLRAQIT